MKIVFIFVVEMHYHLKFSEDSMSVTRAREGTWKQEILGFLKFLKINCSVTCTCASYYNIKFGVDLSGAPPRK